jgi:hypothetical protein
MIYSPPYWVHALLWGPLILLTTLAPVEIHRDWAGIELVGNGSQRIFDRLI